MAAGADINYVTKATLQAGDVIVAIDDTVVLGALHEDVVSVMKNAGDAVVVRIMRKVPAKLLTVSALLQAKVKDAATLSLRDELRNHLYKVSMPITSRPKRDDEMEGREYRFVSVATFQRLIAGKELFEYGSHGGHFYGTLKQIPTEPRLETLPTKKTLKKSATFTKAMRAGYGAAQLPPSPRKNHGEDGSDEASVAEILGQSRAAQLGSIAEQPLSELLNSSSQGDAALEEAKKEIRAAIYDMTVPVTTRAPSANEMQGVHYNFVTMEEFHNLIEDGRLLEWGLLGANMYGTLKLTKEQVKPVSHMNRAQTFRRAVEGGPVLPTVQDILAGQEVPEIYRARAATEVLQDTTTESQPIIKRLKHAIYDMTVPVTTRARQAGEEEGREYHFVDKPTFERYIKENLLLEWGTHNNEYYGTMHVKMEDVKSPTRLSRSQTFKTALGGPQSILASDLLNGRRRTSMASDKDQAPIEDLLCDISDLALRKDILAVVYDLSIPVTSRPRRESEVDGREYTFVTTDTFKQWIAEQRFLEWGQHPNGHYYGTLKLQKEDLQRMPRSTRNSRRVTVRLPHEQLPVSTGAGPYSFVVELTKTPGSDSLGLNLMGGCDEVTAEQRQAAPIIEVEVGRMPDQRYGFQFLTHAPTEHCITSVDPGAPAHGKLYSGDEIVAIDGQDVLGMSHEEFADLLVAASAKTVCFSVRRFNQTASAVPMWIQSVFRDSVAATDGRLLSGDQLTAINGLSTSGLTLRDVRAVIVGSEATVSLTIVRDPQLATAIVPF